MDEKWEIAPRSDLEQLVERVAHGESVELTRGGKTVARIVPAKGAGSAPPSWEELAELRKGVRLPEGMSIKDMINDGRTR
ncbi:type II toxin-antitoxin system Phd/YefM family antitoxin [Devosia albogilva]|uniref:Type II toxin-antitoxin system Phd/YefM family antitoxin n=1 Tax=Devosia albogilva TaxID=429726 RepID=A0ABW5QFW6_9HYPH